MILHVQIICSQICFAFKGQLPRNRIRIHARVDATSNTRGYVINLEYIVLLDEWQYTCVDVWQYLYDRFNGESETFQVSRVFFDSSTEPFWIDEFKLSSGEASGK